MVRTFVAVHFPEEVTQSLESLIGELSAAHAGVRWVSARNLHLTLKFLGEVDEADLDPLMASLAMVNLGREELSGALGELGAFPNFNRPRVVWVGLEVEGLAELADQVADRCRAAGLAGDEKKFRPHITVGRVRQGRRVRLAPEGLPQPGPMSFSLRGFSLVASTLTPQGPVYRELGAFSLAGGRR